jgi:predicted glycogen debranching enzyme
MPGDLAGRSVSAGYHWFNDGGRDTRISLPGLALATGRSAEANSILRTFARYLAAGLLPNNFPDSAGVVPGYNTSDATLWYVMAIRAYEEATGDMSLASDLRPALRQIVEHHLAGTRYGIGVDPTDGLLRAGEPGVQLTWMDAKVGDWVVTPRIGKPVEINALWYNVLRTIARMLADREDTARANRFSALADQTRDSFRARFLRTDVDHLADVIDGPDGDDWSMRPNQIFALSLPEPLLDPKEAGMVFNAVGRSLLTSYGLRSLSPADPAYRGEYGGDQLSRDGAYHQGPVWSWLLGPYAEASYRIFGDRAAALAILRPIGDHLRDAGLGSVSEIFEGNAPHLAKGCIAQAWGVAETVRVWRLLDQTASSATAD